MSSTGGGSEVAPNRRSAVMFGRKIAVWNGQVRLTHVFPVILEAADMADNSKDSLFSRTFTVHGEDPRYDSIANASHSFYQVTRLEVKSFSVYGFPLVCCECTFSIIKPHAVKAASTNHCT